MVNFNQSSYGVMEDAGSVTMVILLSQLSPVPFQLEISTIDVTAESSNRNIKIIYLYTYVVTDIIDYIGGMITVDVPAGITAQSFTIDIIDNDLVDCVKRFNTTMVSTTLCTVATGNESSSEVIIMDHNEGIQCDTIYIRQIFKRENFCDFHISLLYIYHKCFEMNS